MRVVHLSCWYGEKNTGGAAIAATRLHLALLNAGVESHFVCYEKWGDGPNVHVLPEGRWRWLHAGVSQRIKVFLERFARVFKTGVGEWGLYLHLMPMFGLGKLIRSIDPDVVHVHWVSYDSVTFGQLARVHRPMVFNLHDFYMINAIEPVPCKDNRIVSGYTWENSTWFERWWLRRKISLCKRTRALYVAPSNWAREMCKNSVVAHGAPAYAISNIIEMPRYVPDVGKDCPTKMVILFGAILGRQDPNKGWNVLVSALERIDPQIARSIRVACFGRDEFDPYSLNNGVEIISLGEKRSTAELSQVYCSADVLAVASLSETQGMTKCEALLCGLPVLAFDRTACAEGIEHKVNGWVSPDGDVADYAKGIEYFYGLWKSGELEKMRGPIAEKAAETFAVDKIVSQYLAVYKSAIARQKIRGFARTERRFARKFSAEFSILPHT